MHLGLWGIVSCFYSFVLRSLYSIHEVTALFCQSPSSFLWLVSKRRGSRSIITVDDLMYMITTKASSKSEQHRELQDSIRLLEKSAGMYKEYAQVYCLRTRCLHGSDLFGAEKIIMAYQEISEGRASRVEGGEKFSCCVTFHFIDCSGKERNPEHHSEKRCNVLPTLCGQ